MYERRVTGNQLAASVEVNAHPMPAGVMPWRTWAFAATISGSSKLMKSKPATGAKTAQVTTRSASETQRLDRDQRRGVSLALEVAAGLARILGTERTFPDGRLIMLEVLKVQRRDARNLKKGACTSAPNRKERNTNCASESA